MMFAFEIAMQHLCTDPFLDFVDYDKVHATHRFGAYTVSHGTAVPELRKLRAVATMRLAMEHICKPAFLHCVDYGRLIATNISLCSIASYGLGRLICLDLYSLSDDSSSDS